MRFNPYFIAIPIIAIAAPAAAQVIDWARAPTMTVTLSSFSFAPETIHLRADQAVVLHLVNAGSGGHNFAARDFFAAANIRAEDRATLRNGAIEVGSNASRDIALVPRAGRYQLRCTHTFHRTLGMSGQIIVD